MEVKVTTTGSILEDLIHNPSTNLLGHSYLIQAKCAQVGFDWPDTAPVFSKVSEELAEVKEAIDNPQKSQTDVQDELGDLLFACVNLCRHLHVDPQEALKQANNKFVKRFQCVEKNLKNTGKSFENTQLDELDLYWEQAKREV